MLAAGGAQGHPSGRADLLQPAAQPSLGVKGGSREPCAGGAGLPMGLHGRGAQGPRRGRPSVWGDTQQCWGGGGSRWAPSDLPGLTPHAPPRWTPARLRGEDGACGRMDVREAAGECCEPCGFKLVWGHVLDLASVNDRRSVGVSLDLTCVRCDGGSSPAPHPTPTPTLTSSSHLALFRPVCCAGGIRAQVSTFDFSWAFTLICSPQ